jgi:glucose dehydrogenase
VVFIGASQDRRLRALDIVNGRELWSAALPSIGAANPMTYASRASGRQYVVIASSDHPGLGGVKGSALLAFALPKSLAVPFPNTP